MAAARDAGDSGAGDWLASALALAPIGFAVLDAELRCIEANERFGSLLGRDPSGAVETTLDAMVGSADGARLGEVARAVLRSAGQAAEAELQVMTPEGRERWLLVKFFGVGEASRGGPAVGMILVDVTDRKVSEDQHAALQRLTSEFAAAVTPEVVADVVIRAVLEAIDATGGALYLLDDTGTRLTAVRAGYPWPADSTLDDVPVSTELPICDAVRNLRPVWVIDEHDLFARFADAAPHGRPGEAWGAHAALPLAVGTDVLGAMVFSWAEPRQFAPEDRSFLEAVAVQCSQALQRATLFRRERTLREHTERVADHVLRVERITGALAIASEPEEVVDRFLDQCLSELGASYGAVLEVDATKQLLVPLGVRTTEAWEPKAVRLDGVGPLAEAARSHQSVLLEDLEQIRTMAGVGAFPLTQEQAWAAIPLVAYGEMLGVAAVRYDGVHRFDADDRAFLDRVGRRLAEALDRSRLYAYQRDAREQAEAAARWLRSVQSLAAALARSATRRDVARALREHLHPATRADFSIVAALSADRRHLDVLTGTSSFAMSTDQIGVSVEGAVRDSILRGRGIELEDAREIRTMFPNLAESGIESFALLPIRTGRSVIGVIGMGWTRSAALTADARRLLAIAVSLGGAAFERAAAYDLDHHIAETLQRHLLTEPALEMSGLSWAARYAPGSVELTAGGDWYDVIELPEGRVALVVGDIVGHGIVAAAAMGQLRSATRALAVREDAVGVLEALDAYVTTTGQGHLSSMAYIVLDPVAGWVEYAVAGHPPPLVRAPDGTTTLIEAARGPLLGIAEPGFRQSTRQPIEPGSTIVLYTDGLIERRGESIDAGLERLGGIVAAADRWLHPEGLCDRLLEQLDDGGAAPDDITLLVMALEPATRQRRYTFPARLEMLRVIRGEVRAWLDANGIDPVTASDIVLACDEACANAVEHGATTPGIETIDITLVADDDEVTVIVADAGTWVQDDLVLHRPHGIQIMQALMYDVQMESDGRGTTVTLRRRRSG